MKHVFNYNNLNVAAIESIYPAYNRKDEFMRHKWHAQLLTKNWKEWLHGFAPWSLAATVTFKRHRGTVAINQSIASGALHHSLRVLDCLYFGRNGANKGYHVASTAVIGWGSYGTHPHAHLALAAPTGSGYDELQDHIEQALTRTLWIDRERVLVPYRSAGWAQYMVDHDPENLILPLLRSGTDPSSNLSSRLVA